MQESINPSWGLDSQDVIEMAMKLNDHEQSLFDEGYEKGMKDSRWKTWEWDSFFVWLGASLLVIALASLPMTMIVMDRLNPTYTYEFITVHGKECVRVDNPMKSESQFVERTKTFCEEMR